MQRLDFSGPAPGSKRTMLILPSAHIPLQEAAERIYQHLATLNKLFCRFGEIVEVVEHELRGQLELSRIKPHQFASRAEERADLFQHAVVKDVAVLKRNICREPIARLLMGCPQAREFLKAIAVLVHSPVLVMGDDRKPRVLAKGYHEHGGGTLVTKGKCPPEIPLEEAVNVLLELTEDFDFETESDRARAIAAFLTPALVWGGHLQGERCPFILFGADKSQAGKGYLAARIGAIYGHELVPIAPRKGGVGSYDEDINNRLVKGDCMPLLDNIRSKMDSEHLESLLTARHTIMARTPYHEPVEVDIRGVIFLATSNGFEMTPDLENRLVSIYIRKRPASFRFKRFNGKPALEHIQQNQSYYLGCVFSIIRFWLENGSPRTHEVRHHFRAWAQIVDWILLNAFKDKLPGRLMDDHGAVRPPEGDSSATGLGFADF